MTNDNSIRADIVDLTRAIDAVLERNGVGAHRCAYCNQTASDHNIERGAFRCVDGSHEFTKREG